MFSPKQNTSPRSNALKNNLPYLTSPKNSQFVGPTLTYNHLQRTDEILYHEKSIVKENIDRLKCLLSQKRQFNRRNREDLSPQVVSKSPLRNKENVWMPQKVQPRPNTVDMSPNKSQQSFLGSHLGRIQNQNLINDIKRKIRASPLRFHEHMAKGNLTKGLISPQSVTLYSDSQIQVNKYLGKLVEQNQTFEASLMQKDNEIARKNKLINQLELKMQEFVLAAQKQEEKIHSILFQKDGEIQCLKLEKEQQIKKIKSEVQTTKKTLIEQLCSFESAHYQKMQDFTQIVSKKLGSYNQFLTEINSCKLLKLKKQIELQKSIFIPENTYRKTKNILQMSPSIKGDNLSQNEQQRLNMERQMIHFESQIQYKKDKYEEMVKEYEEKYKDLEEKFVDSQRKNQSLKNNIQALKEEQAKFIKDYQERLQRKKEFERQHNLSDLEQTLLKATPNSMSVQAPNKKINFKKQLTPLKIEQGGSMTPKNQRINEQALENSLVDKKSQIILKKSSSIKSKKEEKEREQNLYFDEISRIQTKKDDQVDMKELEERVELELKQRRSEMRRKQEEERKFKIIEREYELEQKAKELTAKERQLQMREAKLEEQSKLQQLYMEEMENIKNMIKLIEEAQLKDKISGEQSKILQQKSTTPQKKLKKISKVEHLAKKQRKQKQIVRTRLQTIERELQLEKNKNAQLEDLIVINQKNLFRQIRAKVAKKDSAQQDPISDSESVINEEQSPFDPRLQTLSKTLKTIEESQKSAEWQRRVKIRLEEAIVRLESLEGKCSEEN